MYKLIVIKEIIMKNNCINFFKIIANIEIPFNSDPIKYEFDKKNKIINVDRIMPSTMFYPANYGFIDNTLALDGDTLDILVITPYPLHIMCRIECRPIGMLRTSDEKGEDCKIISVPTNNITNEYDCIKDITDISSYLKNQISFFFEHYKKLENNKWVKIIGWENCESSIKEIEICKNRYKNKKKIY